MQFLVGLIGFWMYHVGAWAAGIGGLSFFLGYVDEVPAFFAANRPMMVGLLLLHFFICAMIYHWSDTRRLAKRAGTALGRS